VIPGLEEIDAVVADKINDAVFLDKPPGPHSWCEIFERLRFSDSTRGVAQDGFD
jgi:hypothetical protein